MIQNNNLSHHFNFICIENIPRSNIPSFVKKVPTILAQGKKPFVGALAFSFINARLLIGQQTNTTESYNKTKRTINKDNNPLLFRKKQHGPNGVASTEIENISDAYAFVEDEDDHKEAQKRLLYLGQTQDEMETMPIEKKKVKRKEQDKRLQMILHLRNSELKINESSLNSDIGQNNNNYINNNYADNNLQFNPLSSIMNTQQYPKYPNYEQQKFSNNRRY
jgi:hypothetical protein